MPKGKHRYGAKNKSPANTKCQSQESGARAAESQENSESQVQIDMTSTIKPSAKIIFRGIKPQCVQERWFDIQITKSSNILQIIELFRRGSGEQLEGQLVYEVPFPALPDGRVLGQPVCVACHENLFILQYHTDRCKYSRFLLVDTARQTALKFEDSLHYLHMHYFTVGPVVCMISPSLQWVLLRLPAPLQLSNSTWAKIMYAELILTDGIVTSITDIKVSSWMDRKNQTLTFHPQYDNCLTVALVDQYCSKCELCLYDLSKNEGIIQRSVRATHKLGLQDHNTSGAQGDFLLQCNASYSHSGDILILCCTVLDPTTNQVCVKLFVLDTERCMIIHRMLHYLEWAPRRSCSSQDFLAFNPNKDINVVTFSACDTSLSLWQLRVGCTPDSKHRQLSAKLPQLHPPRLQALCRAVILQLCPVYKLQQLQLPHRIQAYISYL